MKKVILIFISATLLWGCKKESNISKIPELKFKEYKIFGGDSLQVTVSFTDGDGDVGLNDEDTNGSFSPSSFAFNNLFLYYQVMSDDSSFNYFQYNIDGGVDSLKWRYRFKSITPAGQKKVLEGDITATLLAPYKWPTHTNYRYQIFLLDRALNKSNVVTSGLIK